MSSSNAVHEERSRSGEDILLRTLKFAKNYHAPIIMLVKTSPTIIKRDNPEGSAKCRWKVYLWQPPDDLVSWYLPIPVPGESSSISALQLFDIF